MRQVDRSEPPLGVAKMDRVRERFGWSDHDLADALGVDWSQVSMYRVYGVPDRHVSRLRRLAQMSLEEVRDTSAAHAAGGERDAAVAQPVVVTTGARGGRASHGDRIVVPRTGRPKLMWNGLVNRGHVELAELLLARRTRGSARWMMIEQATGPRCQRGAPAAKRGRTTLTGGGGCYAVGPFGVGGDRVRARPCAGAG